MNPFEDLIHELSQIMDIPLKPDSHQSCLITFFNDELAIQIDLDTNADRIVIGTQLGRITPGPYRDKIFMEALRANGLAPRPQGILAFSTKKDTLILYQFLNLAWLNGAKLHTFLHLFREHALLWKKALATGDTPHLPESAPTTGGSMYGLRP